MHRVTFISAGRCGGNRSVAASNRLFARIFRGPPQPPRLTLNFGGVSELIGCMQVIAECCSD
jgi:hypothetical protein